MANRSEIERQIADLQSQLDDADTDDEVWVKDSSGREVKVTGKKATSILGRFADLWDTEDHGGGDDDDSDDDDKGSAGGSKGGGGKGTPKDKKPASGGYFGRRN